MSTSKQKADSQINQLCLAGCDEIFIETQSGATRKRPELERMLTLLRAGDTVVVVKLDRLSRSLRDLLSITREIESKGAHMRSLQDPYVDTSSPNGKLIFGIIAVLAEYERDLIRARTIDGLAAARERGKRLGRKEALNQEQKDDLISLRQSGMSVRQLARTFGLSKTTILRYLKLAGTPSIQPKQTN